MHIKILIIKKLNKYNKFNNHHNKTIKLTIIISIKANSKFLTNLHKPNTVKSHPILNKISLSPINPSNNTYSIKAILCQKYKQQQYLSTQFQITTISLITKIITYLNQSQYQMTNPHKNKKNPNYHQLHKKSKLDQNKIDDSIIYKYISIHIYLLIPPIFLHSNQSIFPSEDTEF